VNEISVRLQGLQLHRDGRAVLRDIDWTLQPGERWAVLGANGAGKTQLLKLISGAVWPDPQPAGARRYRIRDEWQTAPHALLDEFAYLGPERQDRYDRYEWNFTAQAVVGTGCTRSDIPLRPLRPLEKRRVLQWLRQFDVEALARRRFLTLSQGQRRLVLLARAMATRPQWLLLDELFGGLDDAHRTRVMRWFAGPAMRRASWVLTTHREEDIPAQTTHLLRLAGGRILSRERWKPRGSVIASARRDVLRALAPKRPEPKRAGRPIIQCERVSIFRDWQPILRDLSFVVRPGECWVIHGANGAGKTTLLRALYGDFPAALGGHIRRRGIEPGVPLEQFQKRCGWVAPHLHALHPAGQSLRDLVVSGLRASVGLDAAPSRTERTRAKAALADFDLGRRAEATFGSLSYGQARRALLARASVTRPALLLLDEPCAGIDAETRVQLITDIDRLVAAGTAVVMSTHHRDEWPMATTHEIELVAGRTAYAGRKRG
jgi:molybdate transport system ATP-binding protein